MIIVTVFVTNEYTATLHGEMEEAKGVEDLMEDESQDAQKFVIEVRERRNEAQDGGACRRGQEMQICQVW